MSDAQIKIRDARNYENILLDSLGSIPIPSAEWKTQVEKYSAQGLVETEFFVHLFTSVHLWNEMNRTPIYNITKRIFDLCAALVLLVMSAPILLLCAVAIKLDSPGPVVFRQVRIGHLGRAFSIWKFRSMYLGSSNMLGQLSSDSRGGYFKSKKDFRVTRVGTILRRWSLDELPQLLNVITGDMSLIGPRPLPIYDALATPYARIDRFAAVPGLTGLWQVTARGSEDGLKNFAIDVLYVHTRSWKLDLWILLKTPLVVITGVGAK